MLIIENKDTKKKKKGQAIKKGKKSYVLYVSVSEFDPAITRFPPSRIEERVDAIFQMVNH